MTSSASNNAPVISNGEIADGIAFHDRRTKEVIRWPWLRMAARDGRDDGDSLRSHIIYKHLECHPESRLDKERQVKGK